MESQRGRGGKRPHQIYEQISKTGCDSICGLFGGDNRVHLEVSQILPTRDPLIQESRIARLHQLKTPLEFFIDPTRDVFQSFRSETAAIAEPSINWKGILIQELFNDHVKQSCSSDWFRLLPRNDNRATRNILFTPPTTG